MLLFKDCVMVNGTEELDLHLEFLRFISGIGFRTFQQDDKYITYIVIALLTACIFFVIFLNSFVVNFYREKFSETIPFLFILVALGDIATGIGGIFNIVSLIAYQHVDFPSEDPGFVDPHFQHLVTINYVWCNLAVKMSVFVNVILAVLRTVAIVNPFQRFNRRLITLFSFLYLTIWVLILAGEVYFTKHSINQGWQKYLDKYSNHPNFSINSKMFMYVWYFLFTTVPGYMLSLEGLAQVERKLFCSDNFTCSYHFCYEPPAMRDAFFDNEGCEQFFGFFWLIAPNVLPAVVVLICLVIIIRRLQNVEVDQAACVETSVARKTTVSILLISVVYIVCNTISFFFVILITYTGDYIVNLDPDKVRTFYWLMFGFQNGLPLLSSLMNPVIMISRGTAVRKSFKLMLRYSPSE